MTKGMAMWVVLVAAAGAGGVLAAESTRVYRHVAPDGVVTFSDEPREGAEVIRLLSGACDQDVKLPTRPINGKWK
jgi:hypothetical protein